MKVKLNTSRATQFGGQNIGDVIDVPADEAERMVKVGQASYVETAATKPARTAAARSKAK